MKFSHSARVYASSFLLFTDVSLKLLRLPVLPQPCSLTRLSPLTVNVTKSSRVYGSFIPVLAERTRLSGWIMLSLNLKSSSVNLKKTEPLECKMHVFKVVWVPRLSVA